MRTEARVRQFLEAQLAQEAKLAGLAAGWTDEVGLSLTDTGLVDSLGFINLLMSAEEQFGVEVDLARYDPREFSTVGGFARCIVDAGAASDVA